MHEVGPFFRACHIDGVTSLTSLSFNSQFVFLRCLPLILVPIRWRTLNFVRRKESATPDMIDRTRTAVALPTPKATKLDVFCVRTSLRLASISVESTSSQ